MSQTFQAIYSGGVLRPIRPIDLPESVVVECTPVVPQNENLERDAEITAQKKALDALLAKIDKIPQTPVNDGLHGRDHDQILYGKKS